MTRVGTCWLLCFRSAGHGPPRSWFGRRNDVCERADKRWQVSGQNLPKDVQVDRVVTVNQPIAQSANLVPGDLRVLLPSLRRYAVGRLSEDLTELNEGQAQHSILIEVRAHPLLNQVGGFPRVIEHLLEADGVIMTRHRASPLRARLHR